MKQTTRSLVGLLVLLVVGGAVAVAAAWTGRDEEQKAEQKEKSEKLFEFDQAKAVSLRLEKDGKLVAQAVREEKGWKLTEPGPGEADAQAINGLLGQLATLKQKKDLGEEKDLKAFGLDAPRLFVSVKLQDGSEHGLSFGIDNSFDNTMYVKKAKDPLVRIVDGYVFISGITTIQTITAPSGMATTSGRLYLIPTGIFTTGTLGNIALASTAVVSRVLTMTWDATAAKWYPSY